MINCPKCNKPLADGTMFCDACGTKTNQAAPAPQYAQAAPAPQYAQAAQGQAPQFAQQRAPQFAQAAPGFAPQAPVNPVAPVGEAPAKKKINLTKKQMTIGGSCIALVLVVAIIISIFSGGGKTDDMFFYVKDKDMFFSTAGKLNEQKVTDDLGSESTATPKVTEKGDRVFYYDELDDDATLYYKDIKDLDSEGIKIASDVYEYTISYDGKYVIYLSDGTLYHHDLSEKTKISDDIEEVHGSTSDGKTVLYENDDADVYKWTLKEGGKGEKIFSEISALRYNDEMTKFYYIKDNSLYVKDGDNDPEKIDKDVSSFVRFYEEEDAVYYVKSEENEVKALDYIDDDKKDDEYYDDFRDALKDEKLTLETKSLYYYDGSEPVVVAANYMSSLDSAADKAVIAYKAGESTGKIKMSELSPYDDADSIKSALEYEMSEDAKTYVAVGSVATEVVAEDAQGFALDSEGKYLYYFANIKTPKADDIEYDDYKDEDGNTDYDKYSEALEKAQEDDEKNKNSLYHGELFKAEVKSGSVTAESYDADVYIYSLSLEEDYVTYYKNHKEAEDDKNEKADLYKEKELICEDFYVEGGWEVTEDGTVIYYSDYKTDKSYGSLCAYKKESVTVGDEVHSYRVLPSGDIIVIDEYSSKNDKGTLMVFDGKSSEKLADDVTQIIVPIVVTKK